MCIYLCIYICVFTFSIASLWLKDIFDLNTLYYSFVIIFAIIIFTVLFAPSPEDCTDDYTNNNYSADYCSDNHMYT